MSNSFKIDIDGTFSKDEWFNTLKGVLRIYKPTGAIIRILKTKNGHHIYLDFFEPKNHITAYEIILVQAILKSDLNRELFNLQRVKKNESDWNVLFEEKWQNKTTISKETEEEIYIYADIEQKAKEIQFLKVEKRN